MPAVNTCRTLNDYRVSTESVYKNGSSSKLGAGALVAAIFLGVGAYFFYPMYQRSAATTPASGEMNYQAPAATDSAAPVDTMDSAAMPDAPNATATSPAMPSIDTNAMRAPAQEPGMDRTATEKQSNVAPAQPAQRTKQSTKSPTKSTSQAAPSSPDNTATATPDMIEPAPIVSPQPETTDHVTDTTQYPMAIKSEAPTDAAPDAATP